MWKTGKAVVGRNCRLVWTGLWMLPPGSGPTSERQAEVESNHCITAGLNGSHGPKYYVDHVRTEVYTVVTKDLRQRGCCVSGSGGSDMKIEILTLLTVHKCSSSDVYLQA